MIIFERLGGWGLGNSLFQIATTIAIAHDSNTEFAFYSHCSFVKRYLHYFNHLPIIEEDGINKHYPLWGLGDIRYLKPPQLTNARIDGFFQSDKYFSHIREKVLSVLDIKPEYKHYLKKKYKDILNKKTCTIHVRRNDYFSSREMKVIHIDYYKKAVQHFEEDTLFVIFSDDIEWCESNFDFLKNKLFINEQNDILELYLMSFFKNNIIANSTFSWWGAWIGDNNKVIMPDPSNNWFSDIFYQTQMLNDYTCLKPPNWITIDLPLHPF